MYPRDLQLVQSPALSFKMHLRTTTCQRRLGHFWSTDGSLIGFLRAVVFAASNLLFTVRFRLPTIIRYPSMWLLSSAIHVPPSVRRASASRHTSFGLWLLISVPTGCACSMERMCDSRKARAAMRATMAHNTITVLGVIDVFGVFLEVERSGIDLFTVGSRG